MARNAGVVRTWFSAREWVGSEPPTADDVPISLDGRRLDTPEKVIAFIDEINAKRAAEQGHAGRA